jgi:hypothetical protein
VWGCRREQEMKLNSPFENMFLDLDYYIENNVNEFN